MRVASYCVWALLAGCPAEQLGIPVPHEGIEAISMEDVVRDVTKLSRAPGEADRLAFLDERWRQMGLDPREGGRCGFRSGTGSEAIAVVASPGSSSPREQAPTAVVISVAKAFHGRPADARGVWFCVGSPPVDVVWSTSVDLPAGSGDLDYRQLVEQARALVPEVESHL